MTQRTLVYKPDGIEREFAAKVWDLVWVGEWIWSAPRATHVWLTCGTGAAGGEVE